MIFKCVSELDKNEKRFFLEEIEVFTRLIEVFCEKNNLENNEDSSLTPEVYKELIEIGVINSRSDLNQLKKVLKKNYDSFIVKAKICIILGCHAHLPLPFSQRISTLSLKNKRG